MLMRDLKYDPFQIYNIINTKHTFSLFLSTLSYLPTDLPLALRYLLFRPPLYIITYIQ